MQLEGRIRFLATPSSSHLEDEYDGIPEESPIVPHVIPPVLVKIGLRRSSVHEW